jgi:hypothetical protein
LNNQLHNPAALRKRSYIPCSTDYTNGGKGMQNAILKYQIGFGSAVKTPQFFGSASTKAAISGRFGLLFQTKYS